MIIGIEILCDNCLSHGKQVSESFVVTRDEDNLPVISVKCPTCGEVLDHVFVGVGSFDDIRLVSSEPPTKRSCNRHADCDIAEQAVMAKYGCQRHEISASFHCHDEACEDCFGS